MNGYVVDPIVSAVAGDSHRNAEVRRGLQPLVDLGASLGCAVLGITHHTKGTQGREPVERVTGSIAFGALARVVFAAAKMPDDQGGGRVFCRTKANIGPDGGGWNYDIEITEIDGGITASRIRWGDAIDGSAREILAMAEQIEDNDERKSALSEAKDFLRNILVSGPVPKKDVVGKAKSEGISPATLKRAKEALGVESEKRGFGKEAVTFWSFPEGHFHVGEDHTGSENTYKPKKSCQENVSQYGNLEPVWEEADPKTPWPKTDQNDIVELTI